MSLTASSGPLEGVVVLDLTTALAGPYATQLLAGFGARVIKVENPAGGDASRRNSPYVSPRGPSIRKRDEQDVSFALLSRNRRKESITIDLKTDEGRELFRALSAKAHVIVENFSKGVVDRLGIGYSEISAINPAIVYCSISGFGGMPEDPSGKSMDNIVQALSGLMMTAGMEGEPPVRSGVPFGDLSAPMFAAIGILAALRKAEATGVGDHIDISLLGVLTSLVAAEPWQILRQTGIPIRSGNQIPRLAPFGVFATRDGHVAICGARDPLARGVFEAMGRADLTDDPRFRTRDDRVANSAEVIRLVSEWTAGLSSEDTVAACLERGVPAAVVRGPEDALTDPRAIARGEVVPAWGSGSRDEGVDPIYVTGVPMVFRKTNVHLNGRAPELGEHNETVLAELLGLTPAAVADLGHRGVI